MANSSQQVDADEQANQHQQANKVPLLHDVPPSLYSHSFRPAASMAQCKRRAPKLVTQDQCGASWPRAPSNQPPGNMWSLSEASPESWSHSVQSTNVRISQVGHHSVHPFLSDCLSVCPSKSPDRQNAKTAAPYSNCCAGGWPPRTCG